jgi:hypothetical protein
MLQASTTPTVEICMGFIPTRPCDDHAASWFTCAALRALALRYAGVDHVSDCVLSPDERRLLAQLTTVRVGHGDQLCWPLCEVVGDD